MTGFTRGDRSQPISLSHAHTATSVRYKRRKTRPPKIKSSRTGADAKAGGKDRRPVSPATWFASVRVSCLFSSAQRFETDAASGVNLERKRCSFWKPEVEGVMADTYF